MLPQEMCEQRNMAVLQPPQHPVVTTSLWRNVWTEKYGCPPATPTSRCHHVPLKKCVNREIWLSSSHPNIPLSPRPFEEMCEQRNMAVLQPPQHPVVTTSLWRNVWTEKYGCPPATPTSRCHHVPLKKCVNREIWLSSSHPNIPLSPRPFGSSLGACS